MKYMKESIKWGFITFIIIINISFINAVTINELYKCKEDCMSIRNVKSNDCTNKYDVCKEDANSMMKSCLLMNKTIRLQCIKESRNILTECGKEKLNCKKTANEFFNRCNRKCVYENKNITCNNKYPAGELFLDGCKICECLYSGRISCKTNEFCNFKDFKVNKEVCEPNALSQTLCSGSIYSMKCSRETYCQCSGNFNYSCPEGYYCLKEFNLNTHKRGQFSQGWVKLPQIHIGDIGICAKIENITTCGNGICNNLVLENNPGETIYNCPIDCKVQSSFIA